MKPARARTRARTTALILLLLPLLLLGCATSEYEEYDDIPDDCALNGVYMGDTQLNPLLLAADQGLQFYVDDGGEIALEAAAGQSAGSDQGNNEVAGSDDDGSLPIRINGDNTNNVQVWIESIQICGQPPEEGYAGDLWYSCMRKDGPFRDDPWNSASGGDGEGGSDGSEPR